MMADGLKNYLLISIIMASLLPIAVPCISRSSGGAPLLEVAFDLTAFTIGYFPSSLNEAVQLCTGYQEYYEH